MLQEVDVLTFSLSASFQISYIKSNFHCFFVILVILFFS